jgi:hypothetical protein
VKREKQRCYRGCPCLYLSTEEGKFFFGVFASVDKSFRLLFSALKKGKITSDIYKNVFYIWDDAIQDYENFINELHKQFEVTDYVKRKMPSVKKEVVSSLRNHGLKIPIEARTLHGKSLFRVTQTTDITFKVLDFFILSGDINIEVMLKVHEQFEIKKKSFFTLVKELKIIVESLQGSRRSTHGGTQTPCDINVQSHRRKTESTSGTA